MTDRPNTNPLTNIPFGVHAGKNFPDVIHDIQNHGDSLSRRMAVDEIRNSVRGLIENLPVHHADDLIETVTDDICDQCEFQFDEETYEYNEDESGCTFILGFLGGAHLIWVTGGPWATRCVTCSPCVPGAGDLDNPSEDGSWAHCLAPDDYKHAYADGFDNIPRFIYPIENNEIQMDKPFDLWTHCGKADS